MGHGHDHGGSKKKKKPVSSAKKVAFFIIGTLTFFYCLGELGVALYINSLTLLSDGFHNLSDVVSLYIAYWAQNAAQRDQSDDMSYGWGRTEVSLKYSRYTTTIIAGLSHGHSHSHGHGHGHGHAEKKTGVKSKKDKQEAAALLGSVNFEGSESEGSESEHDHDHDEHDHDHAHGHDHGHEHGHDHKHKGEKKDKAHKHKKDKHKHDHEIFPMRESKAKNKKKKGMFAGMDLNMWAVFIHYLGDTVSSLVVLGTGILLHYFHAGWTLYIDPVSSLVIVVLIVASTVPLVKRCSKILLQGVPDEVDVDSLRNDIGSLDNVVSIHDLHIWQLVDGMSIASVHLAVEEGGNLGDVLYHVKKIFHDHGIHSSAIQPEFVVSNGQGNVCAQNCVEDCEEDWCCKNTAERNTEKHLTV